MARPSRRDEMTAILSPLARDILKHLEASGVSLDIDQTIAFYTFIKRRAAELTEATANGNGNGNGGS